MQSPDVVGRTLPRRDKSFRIIGVLQRGFSELDIGSSPDVWFPVPAGQGGRVLVVLRKQAHPRQLEAALAPTFDQYLKQAPPTQQKPGKRTRDCAVRRQRRDPRVGSVRRGTLSPPPRRCRPISPRRPIHSRKRNVILAATCGRPPLSGQRRVRAGRPLRRRIARSKFLLARRHSMSVEC